VLAGRNTAWNRVWGGREGKGRGVEGEKGREGEGREGKGRGEGGLMCDHVRGSPVCIGRWVAARNSWQLPLAAADDVAGV